MSYEWRYIYAGRRRHLVEDKRGYMANQALCGLTVIRHFWWLETNVFRLPPCKTCEERWEQSRPSSSLQSEANAPTSSP